MSGVLIDAVKARNAAGLKELLAGGGDANARDGEGQTLLMLAAHAGDRASVQALVEAGADVNATDAGGWTALAKSVYNPAVQHGFPDIAQLLIDAGANVEAAIGYGVRPLMLAAGYGEADLVATLLNAGADVQAKNDGGLTAMAMAKTKYDIDVINMLHEAEQEAGAGGCDSRAKPADGASVINFMKRPGK